jgi:hypothetical protein
MQKETLEEAAEKYVENFAMSVQSARQIGFKDGAKWQQERMYSEEEVVNILNEHWDILDLWYNDCILNVPKAAIWFNQYYKK